MRNCKECGKRIYRGKSLMAWYGWVLRLCRYCYRAKFPRRKMWDLPPLRLGSERLLSWDDRRRRERRGFNPMLWSPEFRKEWLEYMQAKNRGEVRI